MIGGEDGQIAGAQAGQERADAAVEPFQLPRIARHVTTVAEVGVKLDKVGKGQGTFLSRIGQRHQMFGKSSVILRLPQLADAAMGKDVTDLADGMGGAARVRCPIQQRRRRRRDGKVAAVAGALERTFGADEWPSNSAAHFHGV